MDDDLTTSTATMTSVTEDSGDESDEVTGNDIETSPLTTSDACEEGNSTVIHVPSLPAAPCDRVDQEELDIADPDHSENEDLSTTNEETDPRDKKQNPHLTSTPVISDNRRRKKDNSKEEDGHEQSGPGVHDVSFPNLLGPGKWFEQSCFDHYWRHYQFVSMWCQKHMQVYRTVVRQQNRMLAQHQVSQQQRLRQAQKCAGAGSPPSDNTVFKKPISGRTIQNRKARRRRKAAKKRQRDALQNAMLSGSSASLSEASSKDRHKDEAEDEGETTTESAADTMEDGETQMEISEEMLDFFAHTHKHRQERDAKKKNKITGKEDKHVNIEEVRGDQKERTGAAPTERPGLKRTSEMRHLYGKGAAMIHGMETALQMTFDRNLDVKQPKLWPNMPLRVIFD